MMKFAPPNVTVLRAVACATAMLACLALIACASGPQTPAGNSFVIEDHSYDEVWNAAITAVSRNLTVTSRSKLRGEIHAEWRVSTTKWGELVALSITPSDPRATRFTVTVDSRKQAEFQMTARDSIRAIRASMEAALGA
jgi:hypothetical protein